MDIDQEVYKQLGFHIPLLEFCSNFNRAPFEVDLSHFMFRMNGHPRVSSFVVIVNDVETAFQACKAVYIPDFLDILNSTTPGIAKRKGKSITKRADWNNISLSLMKFLRTIQFEQNHDLIKKLINTGDLELIEWNSWGDDFWGKITETGVGENHLGKILMELREEFKNDRRLGQILYG